MKFSVVVPLYNKAYSIHRCIDSVLSQIDSNFEIIIIDDGSTDSSVNIVCTYFDSQIESGLIQIIKQENQGVSVARNKGVKLSSSNFICFLDADDEWKPDFLKNINKLIESYPEAGLFCLQHETMLNGKCVRNKSLYKKGYFGLVDNFFKRSLLGSLANSSKVCIRKNVIEEIGGFPVGQISGEDLFVWIKISSTYPVVFFNKVSTRINMVSDLSRKGRGMSIPYPITYYSNPIHNKELTFWVELYLYKIYIVHLIESTRHLHYKELVTRLEAGKALFPITTFVLKCLSFALKFINRRE